MKNLGLTQDPYDCSIIIHVPNSFKQHQTYFYTVQRKIPLHIDQDKLSPTL